MTETPGAALAEALAPASHGHEGLREFQEFLRPLSPQDRVNWLAANIVTPPITHAEAVARCGEPVDPFNVLQGDIVRTSAPYQLGRRFEDGSYIIATSSCDLIPGRRTSALLFPVQARRASEFDSKKAAFGEIASLSLYRAAKYFYLPVLADDDDDVIYNVAHLDPLAIATNEAINLAERRGSLTTVGWRIFGTLARALLIREAEGEDRMRPGA